MFSATTPFLLPCPRLFIRILVIKNQFNFPLLQEAPTSTADSEHSPSFSLSQTRFPAAKEIAKAQELHLLLRTLTVPSPSVLIKYICSINACIYSHLQNHMTQSKQYQPFLPGQIRNRGVKCHFDFPQVHREKYSKPMSKKEPNSTNQ